VKFDSVEKHLELSVSDGVIRTRYHEDGYIHARDAATANALDKAFS